MPKQKDVDYSTIEINCHIHADGDVYIEAKKGHMYYIGCLSVEEPDCVPVPHPAYLEAKKKIKKFSIKKEKFSEFLNKNNSKKCTKKMNKTKA